MNDLLIRYLAQLTKEYPYIRLHTDNSSTTISLGYEYADKKEDVSHRRFLPFEKYPIRIDFQKVQTHFRVKSTICTITESTEMLLETKTKFEAENIQNADLLALHYTHLKLYSNNERNDFLTAHPRVVLEVSPNKEIFSNNAGYDLVAVVMLSTTQRYDSIYDAKFTFCGMTKVGKSFTTCHEQIWWSLPKEENLDFFILRKDAKHNSTICEIINKNP